MIRVLVVDDDYHFFDHFVEIHFVTDIYLDSAVLVAIDFVYSLPV